MKRILRACALLLCLLLMLSACDQTGGQQSPSTSPTVPQTTSPTVPETTMPTVPETTVPTVPETTSPTVPETTFPTVPETTEVTETPGSMLPAQYDRIIQTIVSTYPWQDHEPTDLDDPEQSYLYRYWGTLDNIGFTTADLDHNGQEELIIADVNAPFVYDLYTIEDGQPVHLLEGAARFSYTLYENGWIMNLWSSSAATNGYDFYRYENGTLTFVERITLDAAYALKIGIISDPWEATADNCLFRSPSTNEADYLHISSQEADSALAAYEAKGEKLDLTYTLLSEY